MLKQHACFFGLADQTILDRLASRISQRKLSWWSLSAFVRPGFCCFTLAVNITFLMQPHHLCYHSLRYHENTTSVHKTDTDLNKSKKKSCPFTDVALSSIIHQIRREIRLRCTSDLAWHLWHSGPNKAQQSMCSAFPTDISRLRYTLLDNNNTSHHNTVCCCVLVDGG